MEYAIPGFIQKFCTPNALTTLQEYLVDHASPETRAAGEQIIQRELDKTPPSAGKEELERRINRIASSDDRDLYY
jgi:2-iminoacetate synthase